MGAKDRPRTTESPKAEVGEIDTRAPFESVKDAVVLFGEGSFSGEKPAIKKSKPQSAERVLAKETQLHLAQKELNKLKDQLKNAETTKALALVELEKSKTTVDDLTDKLKTVTVTKESAIKATEAAKNQAKQLEETYSDNANGTNGVWKQDLENARDQYTRSISELDAAKAALRLIRQDFDASLEAKASAFVQAREAEHTAKVNMERAGELSKEITAIQESIGQVKLAALQAQKDQAEIFVEKDVRKKLHRARLEESAEKLLALKKELDPELSNNLELRISETAAEIGILRKEIETVKDSDLDSVRTVTLELDNAKESLHKVLEDESSLQSMLESMKVELEKLRKEHSELKVKEAETESLAGTLHVKLRKSNTELEAALSEEAKARDASEEIITTLQQLFSECESARREAEEMNWKAEELKKEAEMTRVVLEEEEKKLRTALSEAEEAKEDEIRALDQIKILSERTNARRASTSESGAQITISREEFESLSGKVGESEKLTEMKVAAAMAQVDAVRASDNEALKRLDLAHKEVEDTKVTTREALKRAEMAEAARKAVEGELRRWREREQKKAAEAASRILAEPEMFSEPSPQNHRTEKRDALENYYGVQKLEKERSMVSKKALSPNLSGIFRRKKNQI